jgi:hypothetical protein
LRASRHLLGAECVKRQTACRQGFATGEMGFTVSLHGSNPEPPMSVLGQKQKSEDVQSMSALPPKADMGEACLKIR